MWIHSYFLSLPVYRLLVGAKHDNLTNVLKRKNNSPTIVLSAQTDCFFFTKLLLIGQCYVKTHHAAE